MLPERRSNQASNQPKQCCGHDVLLRRIRKTCGPNAPRIHSIHFVQSVVVNGDQHLRRGTAWRCFSACACVFMCVYGLCTVFVERLFVRRNRHTPKLYTSHISTRKCVSQCFVYALFHLLHVDDGVATVEIRLNRMFTVCTPKNPETHTQRNVACALVVSGSTILVTLCI